MGDICDKLRRDDTVGMKADLGKRDWSLMPWSALEEVVKVLEFGAKKYAPNNWKYVVPAKYRYKNACMRHLTAYMEGKEIDNETGLSHMAHVACNALFLLFLEQEGGVDEDNQSAS
jgi:hypothetical protein